MIGGCFSIATNADEISGKKVFHWYTEWKVDEKLQISVLCIKRKFWIEHQMDLSREKRLKGVTFLCHARSDLQYCGRIYNTAVKHGGCKEINYFIYGCVEESWLVPLRT